MYLQGSKEFAHHLATYGSQTDFGYKDFIPRFTAARFDPGQWADLFARAGARFVVPVAEHHDGFAMYDCGRSTWDAVAMGPKRDVVGELARATRERGMVFGVSSHRAEHWWFYDEGRKSPSDVSDPRYAGLYGPAEPRGTQPDRAFLDDWLARLVELVDTYQPQLIWFDWWIEQPAFAPYLRRFAAYYYNRAATWGREVAINFKHRAFPPGAAVFDVERGQLSDVHPAFWQADTSIARNSWGYVQNQDYKSAASLIGDLVDVVSKNGALLLNVGPRPDGTIPEPEEEILREIGRWLAVNGEAIFGTRPWKVYGEGPTEVIAGSFADTKRQPFTERDVRFTTRGDDLYAIVLGVPEREATIRSLGSNLRLYPERIGDVRLIGIDEPVSWSRDEDALRVKLPSTKPSAHAIALKISP
jgi:alpha-L-fucosidase